MSYKTMDEVFDYEQHECDKLPYNDTMRTLIQKDEKPWTIYSIDWSDISPPNKMPTYIAIHYFKYCPYCGEKLDAMD
jgi:hypothetical protein